MRSSATRKKYTWSHSASGGWSAQVPAMVKGLSRLPDTVSGTCAAVLNAGTRPVPRHSTNCSLSPAARSCAAAHYEAPHGSRPSRHLRTRLQRASSCMLALAAAISPPVGIPTSTTCITVAEIYALPDQALRPPPPPAHNAPRCNIASPFLPVASTTERPSRSGRSDVVDPGSFSASGGWRRLRGTHLVFAGAASVVVLLPVARRATAMGAPVRRPCSPQTNRRSTPPRLTALPVTGRWPCRGWLGGARVRGSYVRCALPARTQNRLLRRVTRHSLLGSSPSSKSCASRIPKPAANLSTSARSKKWTMKPPFSYIPSPTDTPTA